MSNERHNKSRCSESASDSDADSGCAPASGEELLPVVYKELRRLAAKKLAHESPGQTLQPTALVHEAYLRIVGDNHENQWESTRHFYAAAAEAMRRILIETARRKKRLKHGGHLKRAEILENDLATNVSTEELVAVDDALSRLIFLDEQAGTIVKMRYFTGMTIEEIAKTVGISRATAFRNWTYGRAWIRRHIFAQEQSS